jgi:hypothetical protein
MDKKVRESMEKIWGKDWDKETLSNKMANVEWSTVFAIATLVVTTLGFITSAFLLLALL